MNDGEPRQTSKEYAGERDMDRFWETAKLQREPARQWWYIPIVVGLILLSVPWFATSEPFVEGEVGSFHFFGWIQPLVSLDGIFFGLPAWIWMSLGCTLGISTLTTIAALRFWRDDERD